MLFLASRVTLSKLRRCRRLMVASWTRCFAFSVKFRKWRVCTCTISSSSSQLPFHWPMARRPLQPASYATAAMTWMQGDQDSHGTLYLEPALRMQPAWQSNALHQMQHDAAQSLRCGAPAHGRPWACLGTLHVGHLAVRCGSARALTRGK